MSLYRTPLRSARYLMIKGVDINDFVCQICSTVVWEPEVCAMCNRCYCKKCILDYVFHKSTCFCGDKFVPDDSYKSPDRLQSLRFICPKCKKIVAYAETEAHQGACCNELKPASPRAGSPRQQSKKTDFNPLKTQPISGTNFNDVKKIQPPKEFLANTNFYNGTGRDQNSEIDQYQKNTSGESILVFEENKESEYQEYLKMLEKEQDMKEEKIQYSPSSIKHHRKLTPLELFKPDTKVLDEVNALMEEFEQEDKLLAEKYNQIALEIQTSSKLRELELKENDTLASRTEMVEQNSRKQLTLDSEGQRKISELLQEVSPREANPDKELIELAMNLQESGSDKEDYYKINKKLNDKLRKKL